MPLRRVKISYGRTIQDKPYHSIHMDISLEKDIPDDANLKEAIDVSIESLSNYTHAKLNQIAKRLNDK